MPGNYTRVACVCYLPTFSTCRQNKWLGTPRGFAGTEERHPAKPCIARHDAYGKSLLARIHKGIAPRNVQDEGKPTLEWLVFEAIPTEDEAEDSGNFFDL